jgi:hypothetical protein
MNLGECWNENEFFLEQNDLSNQFSPPLQTLTETLTEVIKNALILPNAT